MTTSKGIAGAELAHRVFLEIDEFKNSLSSLPSTHGEAESKLRTRGLDPREIADRRAAFVTNPDVDATAVLANYELLHGTRYLDRAAKDAGASLQAEGVLAIFRGAEICLHNLRVLADRTVEDLRAGDVGQAAVKVAWANHFHTTLHVLAQAVVQIAGCADGGGRLSIGMSPTHRLYTASAQRMHDALTACCPEAPGDIARHDLDTPTRYVHFNAYVNENYRLMWEAAFDDVKVPGIAPLQDEGAERFFERIVNVGELHDAVHSVDLKDTTYLMQFRAYHQISEVLVKFVNHQLCEVVQMLLQAPDEALHDAEERLRVCCRLLGVVNDNIRPIVRTLSPRAYLAIRPALGTTSGSHSHNLRKGLFQTVYPLLVRVLRLRLAGFDEAAAERDAGIEQRAREVLAADRNGPLAAVILLAVQVFQHVRVWRDEHIQFVKTQIGIGRSDGLPTASISGAENAAQTADRFRQVHKSDPIGPLHAAAFGRYPSPPLPLVRAGGYDEHMAHLTADAVNLMYPDVQERVHHRRRAPA